MAHLLLAAWEAAVGAQMKQALVEGVAGHHFQAQMARVELKVVGEVALLEHDPLLEVLEEVEVHSLKQVP